MPVIYILCDLHLEMKEAAKACHANVTHASSIEYIFDIKEWISPHLDKIKYHTEPHVFCFKKNPSGKAAMFYKKRSHCEWEPDNDGCILLKVCFIKVSYVIFYFSFFKKLTWYVQSSYNGNCVCSSFIFTIKSNCVYIQCIRRKNMPQGCCVRILQ